MRNLWDFFFANGRSSRVSCMGRQNSRGAKRRSSLQKSLRNSTLRIEPLEERRLLALSSLSVAGVNFDVSQDVSGNGWSWDYSEQKLTLDSFVGGAFVGTFNDMSVNANLGARTITLDLQSGDTHITNAGVGADGFRLTNGKVKIVGSSDYYVYGGIFVAGDGTTGKNIDVSGFTGHLYYGETQIDYFANDYTELYNIINKTDTYATTGMAVGSSAVVMIASNLTRTSSDNQLIIQGKRNVTLLSSGDWTISHTTSDTSSTRSKTALLVVNGNGVNGGSVDTDTTLTLGSATRLGSSTLTVDGTWMILDSTGVLKETRVSTAPLIHNAGTFNLYDGVVLTNSYNSSTSTANPAASAGGVYVAGPDSPSNTASGVNAKTNAMLTVNDAGELVRADGTVASAGRAVFNMYGGEISDNKSNRGGGVQSYGIVNLHGGTIVRNEALLEAGGLWSRGYVFMDGGVISSNLCTVYASIDNGKGGGIHNSVGAYLRIDGGEISNNEAVRGGGIYAGGNGFATTIINGGLITRNYASGIYTGDTTRGDGGGIWGNSSLHIYGGEISYNWTKSNLGNGVYLKAADSSTSLDPTLHIGGNGRIDTTNKVYIGTFYQQKDRKDTTNPLVPIRVETELTGTGAVMLVGIPSSVTPTIDFPLVYFAEGLSVTSNRFLLDSAEWEFSRTASVWSGGTFPQDASNYKQMVVFQTVDNTQTYHLRLGDVFFSSFTDMIRWGQQCYQTQYWRYDTATLHDGGTVTLDGVDYTLSVSGVGAGEDFVLLQNGERVGYGKNITTPIPISELLKTAFYLDSTGEEIYIADRVTPYVKAIYDHGYGLVADKPLPIAVIHNSVVEQGGEIYGYTQIFSETAYTKAVAVSRFGSAELENYSNYSRVTFTTEGVSCTKMNTAFLWGEFGDYEIVLHRDVVIPEGDNAVLTVTRDAGLIFGDGNGTLSLNGNYQQAVDGAFVYVLGTFVVNENASVTNYRNDYTGVTDLARGSGGVVLGGYDSNGDGVEDRGGVLDLYGNIEICAGMVSGGVSVFSPYAVVNFYGGSIVNCTAGLLDASGVAQGYTGAGAIMNAVGKTTSTGRTWFTLNGGSTPIAWLEGPIGDGTEFIVGGVTYRVTDYDATTGACTFVVSGSETRVGSGVRTEGGDLTVSWNHSTLDAHEALWGNDTVTWFYAADGTLRGSSTQVIAVGDTFTWYDYTNEMDVTWTVGDATGNVGEYSLLNSSKAVVGTAVVRSVSFTDLEAGGTINIDDATWFYADAVLGAVEGAVSDGQTVTLNGVDYTAKVKDNMIRLIRTGMGEYNSTTNRTVFSVGGVQCDLVFIGKLTAKDIGRQIDLRDGDVLRKFYVTSVTADGEVILSTLEAPCAVGTYDGSRTVFVAPGTVSAIGKINGNIAENSKIIVGNNCFTVSTTAEGVAQMTGGGFGESIVVDGTTETTFYGYDRAGTKVWLGSVDGMIGTTVTLQGVTYNVTRDGDAITLSVTTNVTLMAGNNCFTVNIVDGVTYVTAVGTGVTTGTGTDAVTTFYGRDQSGTQTTLGSIDGTVSSGDTVLLRGIRYLVNVDARGRITLSTTGTEKETSSLISENIGVYGGIYNTGTLNMYAGEISNNHNPHEAITITTDTFYANATKVVYAEDTTYSVNTLTAWVDSSIWGESDDGSLYHVSLNMGRTSVMSGRFTGTLVLNVNGTLSTYSYEALGVTDGNTIKSATYDYYCRGGSTFTLYNVTIPGLTLGTYKVVGISSVKYQSDFTLNKLANSDLTSDEYHVTQREGVTLSGNVSIGTVNDGSERTYVTVTAKGLEGTTPNEFGLNDYTLAPRYDVSTGQYQKSYVYNFSGLITINGVTYTFNQADIVIDWYTEEGVVDSQGALVPLMEITFRVMSQDFNSGVAIPTGDVTSLSLAGSKAEVIRGNIGVWQYGTFHMGSTALVDQNMVYLDRGHVVTVTEPMDWATYANTLFVIDSCSETPSTVLIHTDFNSTTDFYTFYGTGVYDASSDKTTFSNANGELLGTESGSFNVGDVVTLGERDYFIAQDRGGGSIVIQLKPSDEEVLATTRFSADGKISHLRTDYVIQDAIRGMSPERVNTLVIEYASITYNSNLSGTGMGENDVNHTPNEQYYGDQIVPLSEFVDITTVNPLFVGKTGYVFVGWNTESDGTGDWYFPENAWQRNYMVVALNTVFYAQWSDNIFTTLDDEITPNDGYRSLREAIIISQYSNNSADQYISFSPEPSEWEQYSGKATGSNWDDNDFTKTTKDNKSGIEWSDALPTGMTVTLEGTIYSVVTDIWGELKIVPTVGSGSYLYDTNTKKTTHTFTIGTDTYTLERNGSVVISDRETITLGSKKYTVMKDTNDGNQIYLMEIVGTGTYANGTLSLTLSSGVTESVAGMVNHGQTVEIAGNPYSVIIDTDGNIQLVAIAGTGTYDVLKTTFTANDGTSLGTITGQALTPSMTVTLNLNNYNRLALNSSTYARLSSNTAEEINAVMRAYLNDPTWTVNAPMTAITETLTIDAWNLDLRDQTVLAGTGVEVESEGSYETTFTSNSGIEYSTTVTGTSALVNGQTVTLDGGTKYSVIRDGSSIELANIRGTVIRRTKLYLAPTADSAAIYVGYLDTEPVVGNTFVGTNGTTYKITSYENQVVKFAVADDTTETVVGGGNRRMTFVSPTGEEIGEVTEDVTAADNGTELTFNGVTYLVVVDPTQCTAGTVDSAIKLIGMANSTVPQRRLSIDASEESRHLNIDAGNNLVSLSGLCFVNGSATNGGSIFVQSGEIEIFSCVFRDNVAKALVRGTGVYQGETTVFTLNAAYGGETFTISHKVTNGEVVTNPTTKINYTAQVNYDDSGNVTGLSLIAVGSGSGGSIANNVGSVRIASYMNRWGMNKELFYTYFSNTGETASTRTNAFNGGAIYNNGEMSLNSVRIVGLNVTGNGGGIYNNFLGDWTTEGTLDGTLASMDIVYSFIVKNEANGYGGGIANYGLLNFTDLSRIEYNKSKLNGGGICNGYTRTVSGEQSALHAGDNMSISYNEAVYGGAVLNASIMDVYGGLFIFNTASENGGAISNAVYRSEYHNEQVGAFGELTISSANDSTYSIFNKNEAVGYGGGIGSWGALHIGNRASITGNIAQVGGDIYVYGADQGGIYWYTSELENLTAAKSSDSSVYIHNTNMVVTLASGIAAMEAPLMEMVYGLDGPDVDLLVDMNGSGNFVNVGSVQSASASALSLPVGTTSFRYKLLANQTVESEVATMSVTVPESLPSGLKQPSRAYTVTENTKFGTSVGTVSPMTKAAKDQVYTYTIVEGDEYFAIDAKGKITTIAAIDYEQTSTITLVIQTSVNGVATWTDPFTVQVKDVNETPVDVGIFDDGEVVRRVELPEGSMVVGTLSARDPEGTPIVAYKLSGADAKLFEVVKNGDVFELRVKSALDFENPISKAGTNQYEVIVNATDSTRKSSADKTPLVITVTDRVYSSDDLITITGSSNTWSVKQVGANVQVSQGKTILFSEPVTAFPTLTIQGSAKNDTLTWNLASWNATNDVSVTFDGMGGTDTVKVVGTSGADAFLFTSDGVTIGETQIELMNTELLTVEGGDGDDRYEFTGFAATQSTTISDKKGVDTFDFGMASEGITLDLSSTKAHQVFGYSLIVKNAPEILIGTDYVDTLTGSRSGTVIYGGGGVDTLTAKGGKNVLIGGAAADQIFGSTGEDLLIGGDLNTDVLPLDTLYNEWILSKSKFDARAAALSGLTSVAVVDGDDMDMLTGGKGQDWFIGEDDEIMDFGLEVRKQDKKN